MTRLFVNDSRLIERKVIRGRTYRRTWDMGDGWKLEALNKRTWTQWYAYKLADDGYIAEASPRTSVRYEALAWLEKRFEKGVDNSE